MGNPYCVKTPGLEYTYYLTLIGFINSVLTLKSLSTHQLLLQWHPCFVQLDFGFLKKVLDMHDKFMVKLTRHDKFKKDRQIGST